MHTQPTREDRQAIRLAPHHTDRTSALIALCLLFAGVALYVISHLGPTEGATVNLGEQVPHASTGITVGP